MYQIFVRKDLMLNAYDEAVREETFVAFLGIIIGIIANNADHVPQCWGYLTPELHIGGGRFENQSKNVCLGGA
jgi:hypothetical protein